MSAVTPPQIGPKVGLPQVRHMCDTSNHIVRLGVGLDTGESGLRLNVLSTKGLYKRDIFHLRSYLQHPAPSLPATFEHGADSVLGVAAQIVCTSSCHHSYLLRFGLAMSSHKKRGRCRSLGVP